MAWFFNNQSTATSTTLEQPGQAPVAAPAPQPPQQGQAPPWGIFSSQAPVAQQGQAPAVGLTGASAAPIPGMPGSSQTAQHVQSPVLQTANQMLHLALQCPPPAVQSAQHTSFMQMWDALRAQWAEAVQARITRNQEVLNQMLAAHPDAERPRVLHATISAIIR